MNKVLYINYIALAINPFLGARLGLAAPASRAWPGAVSAAALGAPAVVEAAQLPKRAEAAAMAGPSKSSKTYSDLF